MLVSLYYALIFHAAGSPTKDDKKKGFGIANTNVMVRSILLVPFPFLSDTGQPETDRLEL